MVVINAFHITFEHDDFEMHFKASEVSFIIEKKHLLKDMQIFVYILSCQFCPSTVWLGFGLSWNNKGYSACKHLLQLWW